MIRVRVVFVTLVASAVVAACQSCSPPAARTSLEAAAPVPAPPAAPSVLTSAKIDELLRAEWTKAGIVPSAPVDDARFLRRAYLDVVGTIPPPDVVTGFAADARPDKRAHLIETLLASPAYAQHWANYWSDVLLGQSPPPIVDKPAFREWVSDRFAKNVPWNQFVTELVTAEGLNSKGGRYGFVPSSPDAGMAATTEDEPASSSGASAVNGAVNWTVKYREAPQDLAGNASRIFLGVQIQCAQCHDHKTEKWKQDDFRGLAACFMRTRTEIMEKDKQKMGRRRVDVTDIGRPLPRFVKNPDLAAFTKASPRALDGTDLSKADDPRRALAAWMTSPENTWLSQAIVNRMWGHFLGRGFVDPIDDFRPSNPVTAPELLSAIASDFESTGYDLKRLIRLITGSQAYQLSSSPRPGVEPAAAVAQDKLWPRFRLEPLGPEELLNALMDATGVEATLRSSGKFDVERIRFVLFNAYSYLFDVDEEFDQSDFEGTISQALALLNGRLVGGGTSDVPGSALDQVLARPGADKDRIEALYLRTVSRKPTPEESDYFVRYVGEPHAADADPASAARAPASSAQSRGPLARLRAMKANAMGKQGTPNLAGPPPLARLENAGTTDPKRRGFEDVFWILLNSSEFTFNH